MASRITLFLSLLLVATNALAIPYSPTYDYGFDTRKLIKRQAQQPIVVAKLPSVNGTVPVRPEIRQMKQNPFKWNLFLLASNPTERAFYQAAATDFRIPYWDWATPPPPGEMVYLAEFGEPGIEVYGPRGWQFIANPLHSYKFRPLDPDVFSEGDHKFPRWTETMRAPFEISDNQSVAHAIEHVRPALQQRLYTLLSNYKDYGPFSNKYWGAATNQSQYDSVESLHDAMHVLVGNRGHLFYIQYSAFDPVFFLHHTMADRIVAMWQILYPTSWVSPQVTMEHSFTMPPGYVQDMYTELKPFYADINGTFWNSAMARDTSAFGYSYAETNSSPRNDLAEDQARLIETINRLYGSSSPSSFSQNQRRSTTNGNRGTLGQVRKGTVSNNHVIDLLHDPDFVTKVVTEDDMYTEWVANVHVLNGALNGSFVVHFFLGEIPEHTSSWTAAPNLVGSMPVFAMKNMGSGNHVSGTVPLTSALMHLISAGAISGLDREDAETYLEEHLRVRVVGEDGKEKSVNTIESLYIQVASSQVRAARNKWELPVWGAVVERFVLHHNQGHTYKHSIIG
ncbi:tyrosinase precursor [Colletotrichum tofieldiae]|nr:tyrosinase precursor [Colletotrichum tofieldiae]GKT75223.1 tyrosinase precursor [Colletotrichum tofieldiae]